MSHDPQDDPVLGKAYDARMARRLLAYVAPQARLIALSITLMLLGMAAQLAQPYIIKLLIDEHIVRGVDQLLHDSSSFDKGRYGSGRHAGALVGGAVLGGRLDPAEEAVPGGGQQASEERRDEVRGYLPP